MRLYAQKIAHYLYARVSALPRNDQVKEKMMMIRETDRQTETKTDRQTDRERSLNTSVYV